METAQPAATQGTVDPVVEQLSELLEEKEDDNKGVEKVACQGQVDFNEFFRDIIQNPNQVISFKKKVGVVSKPMTTAKKNKNEEIYGVDHIRSAKIGKPADNLRALGWVPDETANMTLSDQANKISGRALFPIMQNSKTQHAKNRVNELGMVNFYPIEDQLSPNVFPEILPKNPVPGFAFPALTEGEKISETNKGSIVCQLADAKRLIERQKRELAEADKTIKTQRSSLDIIVKHAPNYKKGAEQGEKLFKDLEKENKKLKQDIEVLQGTVAEREMELLAQTSQNEFLGQQVAELERTAEKYAKLRKAANQRKKKGKRQKKKMIAEGTSFPVSDEVEIYAEEMEVESRADSPDVLDGDGLQEIPQNVTENNENEENVDFSNHERQVTVTFCASICQVESVSLSFPRNIHMLPTQNDEEENSDEFLDCDAGDDDQF